MTKKEEYLLRLFEQDVSGKRPPVQAAMPELLYAIHYLNHKILQNGKQKHL